LRADPAPSKSPCLRTVIGVDCATAAPKVGVARAHFDGGRWRVDEALTASHDRQPAGLLGTWLAQTPGALLALDAPLGWPVALGATLAGHAAGEPIAASAATLFTRLTDHAIYRRTGKRPLEVGADRIARTAVATLALLAALRTSTGHPIPLAWDPRRVAAPSAIEVYPAGTLQQHGLPSRGYKEPGAAPRGVIAHWLRARLEPPAGIDLIRCDGHLLDALLCVAAGIDFLAGVTLGPGPEEAEVAQREGWIWVRG
jgi:hypothetical protein